ncbi:N-acetyl-gamma-glutamyl-phosphate reductase [Wohlfahrtiimonas chitiniclastica SH04]|uniref:N-acetyl-gamma-glutamyl-phosphate reductase n=1 Tax=Wohlfahrtiimonas chitiniclastica SH04 TaxID=1261130 RepID=L8XW45_9GAMM|nr:N-acetyl-gamma-glutamyl-phosphate reductase [Wohlfahrtiimonas chitiniclastica]ELV08273.1 N-acetyl-gamma-glutamyl-phosphate reductase [Wohlfahrtiimonas chitiniclastica SH04]MBS7834134.1 N-acetyl-gamma-glutamyl-phosphate reductase [Wohlfahrtiimonas chitiniclastica]OYQ83224.1 N-acetyl-gamma-glutamyl-phosphate reductase [Wohlfahrtiimonas chitiniclastica]OYQ84196.1 N-acetyl-gamma-glutamyl-phosphate reductase [Wohlfahrtiimonas chitiniclastica]
MSQKSISVGIIGATGYAGQQLVWLLHQHPNVVINFVASHSHSAKQFSEVYRNYESFFDKRLINLEEVEPRLRSIDLLFLALPHGLSEPLTKKALEAGIKVIDLGADFRFDDEKTFEKWYNTQHEDPAINRQAVYGLPELYRDEITHANLVACPGCYPTSAILGVAPLLKMGVVKPSVIVDAKSGVSGAGRSEKLELLFAELNENFKAYGLFSHRHTPEIAQEMSKLLHAPVDVTFTPHLLPINRGILSTIYLDITEPMTEAEVYQQYIAMYKDEPFVRVVNQLPQISHVKNSNLCEVGLRVDEARQKVIVVSAIDNLIKGASGQAVQCMNLMFGIKETTGIHQLSMYI